MNRASSSPPEFNAETVVRKYRSFLPTGPAFRAVGKVTKVVGLVLESEGPPASIGEVCILTDKSGKEIGKAEVVGFQDNRILSMVLGDTTEIAPETKITATGTKLQVGVGEGLLGRILNGLGEPIDGKPMPPIETYRSIYAPPPNPILRQRIRQVFATGIKAIDGLLTLGKGQRVGIFSGSGVGKSVLMGMIARNAAADVNVIGLIGERGREVREFIERDLGAEGLARSVLVVATSDQPPLLRIKAAFVATTIAEFYRDLGLDVLLMIDSVTRFAMAQREVGLAIGEPPTTKGYTPSVFALLPKLMERAGTSDRGTITGLYTVLVEGDDLNEPVSDAARGILDGHIVLSRKLATRGHYPAIDILESVSRIMPDIASPPHLQAAQRVREWWSRYQEAEDLLSVGAYKPGQNPDLDIAVQKKPAIEQFLRQQMNESFSFDQTIQALLQLAQNA